jgi:23S rRNA pseudouridine1911/1915/1917 synthase
VIDEIVPDALDGERVDRVVAMLTGCTRAESTKALATGVVRVDGAVVTKGSVRLGAGQRLSVGADPRQPSPSLSPDPTVVVRVLHEDPHVIVVDKDPGVVVHPGAGTTEGTLAAGLLARYPELEGVGGDPLRPGIVHRLDRDTSGLLVVARTNAAHAALVRQLSTHSVERVYLALVEGIPNPPRATIDAPIGRSRRDPLKMTVSSDGLAARTHIEVVEHFESPRAAAMLRCTLETGRTHQIRVHLRSIGHPVLGDVRYGGGRPGLGLRRPFLHATRLGFSHPVTAEPLVFESPLPADLLEVLARFSPPRATGHPPG